MNIESLRRGDLKHGIMFRLLRGTPVLQLAKLAGFDFVLIDMEHGAYGYESLEEMTLFAKAVGLGVIVRVPQLARAHVSRALDCGADGVMVPMLESAEQARRLVEWAKFSPIGRRGLSSAGGHSNYRKITKTDEFLEAANQETLTIAQIETSAAIREIDAIAATPGLDALLVGPNDLAVSLGCPGEVNGKRVHDSITSVAQACSLFNKVFGMHGPETLLEQWLPSHLNLIVNSLDLDVLAQGLARVSASTAELIQRNSFSVSGNGVRVSYDRATPP